MSVYILSVPPDLQPARQVNNYPAHNEDYGVEQDFTDWLRFNAQFCTTDPAQARWHYLPVYWTRWLVNHDYGKANIPDLQKAASAAILDSAKTFTICQYDDGPCVDLGQSRLYLASRKTKTGVDIPLLSRPHRRPFGWYRKKHLASFIGRLDTHPLRQAMADALKDQPDILITNFRGKSKPFVKRTLESCVVLAPRGYGGSSFRFFEAMELGIAPFLVGDLDTRPFKDQIDWDEISFFTDDPTQVLPLLKSKTKTDLVRMGRRAREVYRKRLQYGTWCELVHQDLIS
ncbi:MAG TPA: hypothetical protein VGC39_06635 [Candidatus Methylacidiphilales bacterium]